MSRLVAKIYEVDRVVCTECGGEMKVVAVIMDPVEVEKILRHLVKTGKSPPGFFVDNSCAEHFDFAQYRWSRSIDQVS